jgi:subtilisin family serine protease
MKAFFASSLAIVLAAGPVLAASPQDAAAPEGPATLAVAHAPVGCMIAGTNPQIDAGISPEAQVQAGRVYFHSALGDAFYYVEMMPEAGRYVGVLPKPRLDAGPITYYVEGVGRDYAQSQTPEARAVVVEKAEDCKDKPLAALGPVDPVRVFSVAGGTALPPGFTGVTSVVAAGSGAATAGTTAAVAAGGVSGKTIAIIGGAIAVGVGTIAIVKTENPPASPSR